VPKPSPAPRQTRAAKDRGWVAALRLSLTSDLGPRSGWTVSEMRGRVLLNVSASAAGGTRQQRVLPLNWSAADRQAIHTAVLAIYADFIDGVPLDLAIETHARGSSQETGSNGLTVGKIINWPQLIQGFKDHKLNSGAIKQSTWDDIYWRRMAVILEAVGGKRRPISSKQLMEAVIETWKDRPGSRGRQLQVQFTAALLRWGVDSERLPSSWSPPLDLSIYVGRKRDERGVTTPIDVAHVLGLVEAIPDLRWRLAFQLMAAYGLRPEELQHLEIRSGQFWTSYQKVSSRGRTRSRVLRLLPCDDWAQAWQLEKAFRPDRMPPMRPGHGAEDLGTYMRRRSLWQQLRREYEEKGEKLVLYSCRHGYAHRAHIICELPPKVVAAAMGHSVETHLGAYSRWCGDDVIDDAFEKATIRLRQT
jgi:integrase